MYDQFQKQNFTIQKYLSSNSPFYSNFSEEQFFNYLEEFGLDTLDYLNTLSLGQRKKVDISFALATNAQVILMDEPTNGLDINSQSQFRKIIGS